jgi:hypothetical protein
MNGVCNLARSYPCVKESANDIYYYLDTLTSLLLPASNTPIFPDFGAGSVVAEMSLATAQESSQQGRPS